MNFQKQFPRIILTFFTIWTFLIGSFLIIGQDLPPNEDLSLGASVFVFRSSGRTAQKKFVSSNKTKRTKTERVVAAKKIRRQYETLAVVTTRRQRIKIAAPQVVVADLKRKTDKEASVILTGSGQYYYEQNQLNDSIAAYRDAIDLDAKNNDAKFGLSDALAALASDSLEKEKVQEARGLFNEAIELNDKNSVAQAGLGEIYDALNDNEKAIASYEKALALDNNLTGIYAPLGILYYQKNDVARADDFLSKALAADVNDATTQYFLGLVRYKQNRYEDARIAFAQAAKLDPIMPEARLSLGEALDKLDREVEAIAEFKEAVRLKPTYVDGWFNLGAVNYEKGNYEEAIAAYKESNRLKNDSGEAHANLADAYRQLKRFGEANGEYGLAAIFIKNDAELYSNWGFCLGKVRKWDSAVLRLNEAIALSADHIDYTNLGWAYYNSAQMDLKSKLPEAAKTKLLLAKTALQQALATNPNFAPANLNLGITFNDLGEFPAAIEVLKRATDARKSWLFAINELGIAYRKTNDYDNAVKQFEKAVALNDKYAIGYYNLGEAQFRRGNVKEAKKALDKLRKLDPNLAKPLDILIVGAKQTQ
ncbi:MAG: tetratricopeptide repeat protein [Pyrinomonadaceae bacterium]|nr:tetratricopeptide repeat protein [Pyrinomonadaceae bacterium]